MGQKIGLLTIGQSPRTDMTPEMKPLLAKGTTFVEAGALDDLSEKEMAALKPDAGETTYISRLRNGRSVKLSKTKLLPHLQQQLNQVEEEEDVTSSIIVCTGSFATLEHTKPVLFPDQIIKHVVQAVLGEGKLGLIVPLAEQKAQQNEKWSGIPTVTAAVSPYEEEDFEEPAKALKEQGATVFLLDCMGYTEEHKARVKSETGLPTLLSRSIVARVAAELAS